MSEIAKRQQGIERAPSERPKSALLFLPAELQESAKFFFGFYSETLKGTYGIANRIRFWMKEDGLTVEEARQAMKNLMSPERSAEIDTAPKAIAALSAEVGMILRDRRAKESATRLRNISSETIPPSETDKVKAKLALGLNLFGMGERA